MKIQHRIDQRRQAARFINDYLHVLRRVLIRQIAHGFGISLNQGKRGSQVMADIGNQLVLHFLYPVQVTGSLRQLLVKLFDLAVPYIFYWLVFTIAECGSRLGGFNQRLGDMSGKHQ